MKKVKIDSDKIVDWDSFHDAFQREFNFPKYYGRNMDAWIDCMDDETFLEEITVLDFGYCKRLKEKNPEIIDAVFECSAFVNHRKIEQGFNPILIISMNL